MRRFFMIFTCAFSVACGDGKTEVENDISCVVINPDRRDVIQVSDFVESVEYIKLEATPESLLKHVDKVYVMDNQLFVADYATKSIYIYDKTGNHRNKISKIGRAGNEYISMDAVMFDSISKEVIVYDLMLEKVLYYTLDGTCRKVVKRFGSKNEATRFIRDMERLPNGNLLCCQYLHGSHEKVHIDGLWEMTSDGEFVRWIKQFDMVHPSLDPIFSFHYMDDGAIGWSPVEYEDDYSYDGKTLKKLISFDVKGPTAKTFTGVYNDQYYNPVPEKMFNSRVYTQHKGDYVLTYWGAQIKGEYYYSLYNICQNKVIVGTINYMMNDGTAILPTAYYKSSEPTFTAVNANIPGVIVSYINSGLFFKEDLPAPMKKTVEKITSGMSENELMNLNPVLQLLRVKK